MRWQQGIKEGTERGAGGRGKRITTNYSFVLRTYVCRYLESLRIHTYVYSLSILDGSIASLNIGACPPPPCMHYAHLCPTVFPSPPPPHWHATSRYAPHLINEAQVPLDGVLILLFLDGQPPLSLPLLLLGMVHCQLSLLRLEHTHTHTHTHRLCQMCVRVRVCMCTCTSAFCSISLVFFLSSSSILSAWMVLVTSMATAEAASSLCSASLSRQRGWKKDTHC